MAPTNPSIWLTGQKEHPENRRNSESLDWECCVCRGITYDTAADSASSFCAGDGLCNHHRCSECLDADEVGSRRSAFDILSDDEGGVLRTLRRNEEVLAAALAPRRRSKRSEAGSENASRGGSSKGSGSVSGLGSFDREVMKSMSGIDLHEGGNGSEGVVGLEGLLRTVREREVLGVGRKREVKGNENTKNGPEEAGDGSENGGELEVGSAESDSGLWMLGARKEASKHNANTETPNLGMSLLSRSIKDLEIEGQNLESDSDGRSSNIFRYRNPDLDEDEDGRSWDGKNSDGEEVERVDMLEFAMREEKKEKDKKCKEKKDYKGGMKTERRTGRNVYGNALFRAAGLY